MQRPRKLFFAYILLILFAAHYAYLSKWKHQAVLWVLFIVSALPFITGYPPLMELMEALSATLKSLELGITSTEFLESSVVLAAKLEQIEKDTYITWTNTVGLVVLLWLIIDSFRLPKMVRRYNAPPVTEQKQE